MASWSEHKMDNVSPPTEDMLEDEALDFMYPARAYDLDSPKHPRYHDLHAGKADTLRQLRKLGEW